MLDGPLRSAICQSTQPDIAVNGGFCSQGSVTSALQVVRALVSGLVVLLASKSPDRRAVFCNGQYKGKPQRSPNGKIARNCVVKWKTPRSPTRPHAQHLRLRLSASKDAIWPAAVASKWPGLESLARTPLPRPADVLAAYMRLERSAARGSFAANRPRRCVEQKCFDWHPLWMWWF